MRFLVEVYRDSYSSHVFEVEAIDAEEAKLVALDELAPNHVFSEKSADYSAGAPQLVKEEQKINLCSHGIKIILRGENPEDATITSDLEPEDHHQAGEMFAVLNMILGHACAGIDVSTPAYIEGIETSLHKIFKL
jgi:hypothetical protein